MWLDACLFVTQYRPVEIKEYIKMGNEIKNCASDETRVVKSNVLGDKLGIFPLIEETLNSNGSLLVFCQSKNACEQFCSTFMPHILKLLCRHSSS